MAKAPGSQQQAATHPQAAILRDLAENYEILRRTFGRDDRQTVGPIIEALRAGAACLENSGQTASADDHPWPGRRTVPHQAA